MTSVSSEHKDLCHSQDSDPKVFFLLLISGGSVARNR